MTDTFFASPYVAANIALLKELMPDISFDALCMYLKLSSKDKGDDGYDTYYGWGVLNPKVLIDNISGGTRVYVSQKDRSNNSIVFIYAIYEEGALRQTYEKTFADEVVLEDVSLTDNTEVKCFVWNSLSQMKPFYKAISVR